MYDNIANIFTLEIYFQKNYVIKRKQKLKNEERNFLKNSNTTSNSTGNKLQIKS